MAKYLAGLAATLLLTSARLAYAQEVQPVSQPAADPASPASILVINGHPAPYSAFVQPTAGGDEASRQAEEKLRWWRQARFGIFVHFGLYALPAKGEWQMWNEKISPEVWGRLAESFHPAPEAAASWAAVAKSAGAKYIVLTAKHHDGFALFDSRTPDGFNSVRTGAHQDIVRPFVDAARREGLRVGLYYSPLDWRYPGYFFPDLYRRSAEEMREKYHRQMTELMSNYGKIDLVWYDGGGENWLGFGGLLDDGGSNWRTRPLSEPYSGNFSWQDRALAEKLRVLQPEFLMSDRTAAPGDFRTRESDASLGDYDDKTPWELATTLTGGWGYQPQLKPRSLDHLIRLLVNVAGRDGNLLLNVGPKADGSIDETEAERLREIGQWLARYGKTIYDTRGGPFLPAGLRSLVLARRTSSTSTSWTRARHRACPSPTRSAR